MTQVKGWIKLHRQMTESSGYLSEPFCRNMAWVDLILLANHTDGVFRVRGVKVYVKRGQVGWTETSLAGRWKWSRTKVRSFLKDLEKEQQIVQQKNNVTTLISLVNYDKYQTKKTAKRTANQTTEVPQVRQQIRQQKDTNKNDSNEENENNVNNLWPTFDDFWNVYDKKADRPKCESLWRKINQTAREKIMSHLTIYIPATPEKKFRKNPATYLRNASWNDEVIVENGKSFSKTDRTEFNDNELIIIQQHASGAPN